MCIRYGVILAGFIGLQIVAPSIAQSDKSSARDLYESIVIASPGEVPYIFDVTYKELLAGEGEGESVEASFEGQFKVDPSKPIGERVTLIKTTDVEDDKRAFDRLMESFNTAKNLSDEFWCGSTAAKAQKEKEKPEEQQSAVSLISQTDTEALFQVAPPKKIVYDPEVFEDKKSFNRAKKVAKIIRAEIALSVPGGYPLFTRSSLTKSFKPSTIARVKSLDTHTECTYLESDGASYRASAQQQMRASAVLVAQINVSTSVTIDNLQPLLAD